MYNLHTLLQDPLPPTRSPVSSITEREKYLEYKITVPRLLIQSIGNYETSPLFWSFLLLLTVHIHPSQEKYISSVRSSLPERPFPYIFVSGLPSLPYSIILPSPIEVRHPCHSRLRESTFVQIPQLPSRSSSRNDTPSLIPHSLSSTVISLPLEV